MWEDMLKKMLKNTRKNIHIIVLAFLVYVMVISCLTVFYLDNPQLIYIDQVSSSVFQKYESITDPLDTEPEKNGADDKTEPDIFDAQVIVMSNIERHTGHPLHLFILPGQGGQLYRDFSVYIFTNQKVDYLIKIDNQTYDSGTGGWMKIVKARSEYDAVDISVTLVNSSLVERKFGFNNLQLLDSPWQTAPGDGDDINIPDIVEPYIKMTQGEMSMFIVKRVFADVVSVIAAIVIGIQIAAMKSDLRGIERVF